MCNFDLLNNPFHEALSEWYVSKKKEGVNRFIVMTPRDHLKTSLFAISNVVWSLLSNPDERIINVMAASRESQKTLSVVQRAFMSQKMKHYFPERFLDPHHPDMSATKDSMLIRRVLDVRESSVEARGLDATMTGGHFSKQIFDDLIDNRIKDSIIEQEKAIQFVQEATNMFIKADADERLIIGTLWEGEFYEWLLYKSGLADMYETLLIGCFVDERYRRFLASIGKRTTLPDGAPIWPEHFSKKTLKQVEREEGPYKFRRQFLNIPVDDDFKRFRREDFRFYHLSDDYKYCVIGENAEHQTRIPIKRLIIRMVVDPATGEGKQTDETAINITGFDPVTGYAFVLEDWASRVLPHKLIDMIINFANKWNVPVVSPEDVSYQKTLKHFLKQAMRDRGARFSIRPVKPLRNASKGTRIEALEPFVRAGQVFVRKEHYKLIDEADKVVIVRGKVQGRSPNRLDAFAYQAPFWNKKAPDVEVDDIEYWNPNRKEQSQVRAYGLACAT